MTIESIPGVTIDNQITPMEQTHPPVVATSPRSELPRNLPPEILEAIIAYAIETYESLGANRELEIASEDDLHCSSCAGDIQNMFAQIEEPGSTWVRAWIKVRHGDVRARMSPKLCGWTEADAKLALAEGWNIALAEKGLAFEVRRDGAAGAFQTDALAFEWVQTHAHEGSALHRKALDIHALFIRKEKETLPHTEATAS